LRSAAVREVQFYFHPALGTTPMPSLMVTSRSAGTSASVCQIPFGQRTWISAFISRAKTEVKSKIVAGEEAGLAREFLRLRYLANLNDHAGANRTPI